VWTEGEVAKYLLLIRASKHPNGHRQEAADDAGPRRSTHEIGISLRHAEGNGLTCPTSDGGLNRVASDVPLHFSLRLIWPPVRLSRELGFHAQCRKHLCNDRR
jgi:hypothetical protein